MLTVNAFRSTMLAYEYVASRSETETAGGFEQAMPPHAAVIRFGAPAESYVPITHTGAGKAKVIAPSERFTESSFLWPILQVHGGDGLGNWRAAVLVRQTQAL
jgi:hypothetical protein